MKTQKVSRNWDQAIAKLRYELAEPSVQEQRRMWVEMLLEDRAARYLAEGKLGCRLLALGIQVERRNDYDPLELEAVVIDLESRVSCVNVRTWGRLHGILEEAKALAEKTRPQRKALFLSKT